MGRLPLCQLFSVCSVEHTILAQKKKRKAVEGRRRKKEWAGKEGESGKEGGLGRKTKAGEENTFTRNTDVRKLKR